MLQKPSTSIVYIDEKKIDLGSPHEDDTLARRLKVKKEIHNMDLAEKDADVMLKTCCNNSTDKRLLRFGATLLVSMTFIIFSFYQLTQIEECHTQNLYVGLITLIIGFWIKSPIE